MAQTWDALVANGECRSLRKMPIIIPDQPTSPRSLIQPAVVVLTRKPPAHESEERDETKNSRRALHSRFLANDYRCGDVVAGAVEDGGGVVASGFGVTCPEAPVSLFDVPVLFGDEPASFSGWLELL
jgi:hypothetical protein